jgi:hypothetical protein
MLPSLLVAAAVTAPGAPIPRDATPNTTGPAPRVVAVRADGNGTVWITAQTWEKRKVVESYVTTENGKQAIKQREVERNVSNYINKSLAEFGTRFSTAEGAALSADDAVRRLKDGATLLVTADGKPVDRGWLAAVDRDTVVMQAEGLAHAHFQYNAYNPGSSHLPTTAAPRLAMFRVDESGAVKVAVNPAGGDASGGQVYYEDFGGARVIRGRAVVWQGDVAWDGAYAPQGAAKPASKPLAEVKFDAYDTRGKLVPRSEALKRLKAGGLVLLAGDTRFPDESYLKAFREDVLVLVSGEFVFAQGTPNPYDMPAKGAGAPPGPGQPTPPLVKPAPAVGVALPAVQLKIAPAVVKQAQVAPAKPEAKPAEKPAARPAEKRD